ncbi:MAG: DUF554 domain-containing protein [Bacillota bacterium]|nr:MAG: DUF554 domain-containing protein [Bacillota bacterium]
MKGLGTLINVATVLAGSGLGVALGSRLPARTRETLTAGLGVVTVLVALDMARATSNILIVLGSVLLGGLVGEGLRLEERLEGLGRRVEGLVAGASHRSEPRRGTGAGGGRVPVEAGAPALAQAGTGGIARGFVAASLLFCVGPMTVLGSLQDGLTGDFQLLAVKAALDGFASIALASTLGAGVALSAATVLVVQGAITILARVLSGLVTGPALDELTATGGALVLMIGLSLLDIKRVPVANFLPALIFAPVIAWLAQRF